jgi:hypothetical protein
MPKRTKNKITELKMLEEILVKLKKRYPYLALWTEGLKEESFEGSTLTLSVPDNIYLQRYENGYKNIIEEVASKKLGRKIYVQLQLSLPNIEVAQSQKTEIETKTELKKFDSNPNFKNKADVEEYVEYTQRNKGASVVISKIEAAKPMPMPYSVEDVACFEGFRHEYFTTPQDKRKFAKVRLKVKCQNGDIKEYELFRGKEREVGKSEGQLDTSHAKILLALIHIWQKQGCRFTENSSSFCSAIRLNLRVLAQALGYKGYSGTIQTWLLDHLRELRNTHNMLSDGENAVAFSFIQDVYTPSRVGKGKGRIGIESIVIFNPFIAKQLYERKAFYRTPECYKLKNPMAIKFLLHYDKAIFKGNVIIKTIAEVVKDLQMENETRKGITKGLKRAVEELNGYELNAEYNIKMAMVKVRNRYVVKAERVHKYRAMLPLLHTKINV